MTETTSLPEDIVEAILWHAVSCMPDEACGLVAADPGGDLRMAYPLTNTDPSPTRFTIAPGEHYGAVRHAEGRGWDIGAVFHSHPAGEATPSPTDLTQPHDPLWLHLIAGFAPTPHIRAWRIRDGSAQEVGIVSHGGRTAS